jgi:hypothetical protein
MRKKNEEIKIIKLHVIIKLTLEYPPTLKSENLNIKKYIKNLEKSTNIQDT